MLYHSYVFHGHEPKKCQTLSDDRLTFTAPLKNDPKVRRARLTSRNVLEARSWQTDNLQLLNVGNLVRVKPLAL